ncbi:MAG TPA: TIGR03557 family F420-dependent LLM class oxidoreductase [Ktedonobacterales bacterium]|nr:TIGR03557 family F420-dependent LLM class oxidoreductase [Ktedonobacterales bacterium]
MGFTGDTQTMAASVGQAKVGFVLSHEQSPPTELIRFGIAAEEAGFDMVWCSDHFQPWQDSQGHAGFAWVTLSALGQHCHRLAMGTGVTCPSFRYHPSVVAQAFATLGMLYPGRIFLGIGAGEALNEMAATGQWGDYRQRATRLTEAVELIRHLWSGERIDYFGRYFRTNCARLYDLPDQSIPLYIAAGGPKSMKMAGAKGDGLVTDARRALERELRQAFEEGASAAGKDAATMPILAEHMVVVGNQQGAEESAQLWCFMPKSWELYVGDPDPLNIQQRAMQDISLSQVYAIWPVSDDPDVHIWALQKLIDGGVSHVFVHSPQADQERVIRFCGEQVLPKISRTVKR